MEITYKDLKNKTHELTVRILWKEVEETRKKIVSTLVSEVEVSGFRKGKAPKELAEKQLNNRVVLEETLKELTIKAYKDGIEKHNLKPFGNPKIEVIKAKEGEEWEIRITVAERPTITLGNYKEALSKVKNKGPKIWTPGEGPKDQKEEPKKPTLPELLETLYGVTTAEVSDIIVEQERERLLSQLLSDIQKLGLTLERYLTSIGKTAEQLNLEYTEQAKRSLVYEWMLEELAEKEKVVVSTKEIDEFIAKAKTPEEKKSLESQRYYLAHLLRKQKALEHLTTI